ncbi:hypothetical protein HMPREF3056_07985 [Corynebacterium sp. HMSC056F09]|uniref:hypothetical protein n=1 Tax=Corynebacterium sp. HMSC056F09 TaxID=1739548 RepID=UPI0008A16AFE|nr:hypothetical protein [Corynebacterium sp. HMSC056F09]OFO21839.1 hypothetical protein HMPREF3056_07985 [Corynebacterium sp. HMSC056F09]
MSNFSRGLLAATLTSSLAFAGATAASAEETSISCGAPKAEFTATVDGKEHTFKKVSEFLWQATDDEEVELTRADIFNLARDGEDVCDSEPIDIDDETDGNTGGDDDADNGDDETGGDDEDSENGDDESDDNTGDDDADNGDDDESEGGDDDADNDDESEGGDDEDSENGDDDESEGDKDKNKDKSSFDGIKDALSSKDGKPTDLGIAAIVIGVLGALAAIVPNAARALGIKLPF